MEFVTLKTFNTEIEAELIKSYLESNNIQSFIFGNILANTYNLFNTTSGGVQLKVYESDLEKAQIILTEFYENKPKQSDLS